MSLKPTETSTEILAPETEDRAPIAHVSLLYSASFDLPRMSVIRAGGLLRSDRRSVSVRAWDRLRLWHGGLVRFGWFTPEPLAWQDKSLRASAPTTEAVLCQDARCRSVRTDLAHNLASSGPGPQPRGV